MPVFISLECHLCFVFGNIWLVPHSGCTPIWSAAHFTCLSVSYRLSVLFFNILFFVLIQKQSDVKPSTVPNVHLSESKFVYLLEETSSVMSRTANKVVGRSCKSTVTACSVISICYQCSLLQFKVCCSFMNI